MAQETIDIIEASLQNNTVGSLWSRSMMKQQAARILHLPGHSKTSTTSGSLPVTTASSETIRPAVPQLARTTGSQAITLQMLSDSMAAVMTTL